MNIKNLAICAALLACAPLLNAIEKVSVRITNNDGNITSLDVPLEKIGGGASKLVIKKEDIPADTKFLDVLADNANAKNGEEGFWLCHRGHLGHFVKDNGFFTTSNHHVALPYYAMKNERETFLAAIQGMRCDFNVIVSAEKGVYTMYPRWRIAESGFKPYEDIEITYYTLPADADYNEMAKAYRKHKFALDPKIKPMKKRFKKQPNLYYQSQALPMKMQFGFKKIKDWKEHKKIKNYTFENQPPVAAMPFAKGAELLRKMKAAGIDKVYICTDGWQDGGYGGRTPSTWPICPEAGGEAELLKFIQTGREVGYLIGAHIDYTDAYTCSKDFTPDMVCRGPTGKMETNGVWGGGLGHNICLNYAWNKWIPQELDRIKKEIDFFGGIDFDVFGAVDPYRCCDPKHPLNGKEGLEIQRKILKISRDQYGMAGQECGDDENIAYVDFLNYTYTSFQGILRKESDPVGHGITLGYIIVPFFELVYHDVIISTSYRGHVPPDFFNTPFSVKDKYTPHMLKLVEFCGRPFIYGVSDKKIPAIKNAYEFFKSYRDLMPEEMTRHSKLAEGVFKTEFGNGAVAIVNYNNTEYVYEGKKVEPQDYLIIRK